MNRFALLTSALLILGAGAPALAQGSRPTKKVPVKTPTKSAKLNKATSLALVQRLCLALEKGDVKAAMGMVATPFLVVGADGKLVKWSAADTEKALGGEFGKRLAARAGSFSKKDAEKMTALYWGPASARGKAAGKSFPELKGAGWVGVIYEGGEAEG